MIAPGNHLDFDSLRGAPPPGEAMGCCRTTATIPLQTTIYRTVSNRESPMVYHLSPANQARIVSGDSPPNYNLPLCTESGEPNGVSFITGQPGSNCQRPLAAKLQFSAQPVMHKRACRYPAGSLFLYLVSSSAIWTQLVAAPLRTWSPQHHRHRPLGSVRSGRIRPT